MSFTPTNDKKVYTCTETVQLSKILKKKKNRFALSSTDYWHKFTIIKGSLFQKKHILNTIIKITSPYFVIPVMYKEEGEDTSFLFQNGVNMIKFLTSNRFLLNLSPDVNLSMNLQLGYCKSDDVSIDPISLIDKVILKRTNLMERIIDLRNFVNDPDLEDIYVPLSSLGVYHLVVAAIKRILPRPCVILLSHNELSDDSIVDSLKVFVVNLKGLDLRFNKLTWKFFHKLPVLKITDLWLDGNPLCDPRKYTSAYIVEQVKKALPSLIRLDGIDISTAPIGNLIPLKNYIAKENYTSMVDHFLHHYFNLYESPVRSHLARLYHPDSFLSISVFNVGSEPANNHSTNEYSKLSRNMLTMSDMTRMYDTLKRGPTEIIQTLTDLPFVMFDPFSFQVDVPIIMKKTIVINVCGVFKDFSNYNPGSLFYFDRTFILVPWEPVLGEWRIINDICAITNATATVADASFTQAKKPLSSDFAVMINNKVKDKNLLQRMVADLTKLNGVWTLKFLTDASWDLEMALQSFIDQYKANLIPAGAFTKGGSDNMELDY